MINLTQQLKQSLRISPKQIQMLNFLQLNTLEIEARIKAELDENPFLEKEESDTALPLSNQNTTQQALYDFMSAGELLNEDVPNTNNSSDVAWQQLPIKQPLSWYNDVLQQLACLSLTARQQQICEFIVFSLDCSGFCRQSLSDLTDDVSFALNKFVDESEVAHCLGIVQSLDPVGLGSPDVPTFLLLQLAQCTDAEAQAAKQVIQHFFYELVHHQYGKIIKANRWEESTFANILKRIQQLRTCPLYGCESPTAEQVIQPDFLLEYAGENIEISLNNGHLPVLQLNQAYLQAFRHIADKTTQQFIQSKISSGNWLIDAIQQREQTMLQVMKALVLVQQDFFQTGDWSLLKPLVLREIAARVGMDISTVSRVTSGKYAQTPFGLLHLKDLFSEGIKTIAGQEVSNKAIQQLILGLIENEDKQMPFNDTQLVEKVKENGFVIARRTVTKYRELLGFPTATERRLWTEN